MVIWASLKIQIKLGINQAPASQSESFDSHPTPAGSYVRFRNAATGLYIDGMGSTANGSNACQWGDSNSTNQQWTIINSGDYVMIQNRVTGCIWTGWAGPATGRFAANGAVAAAPTSSGR